MKYKATFNLEGEVKNYNKYTSERAPYAFVNVKTGYQGKTYISVSLFGDLIDKIKEHDVGRAVNVEGTIRSYKDKKTGEFKEGYTARSVKFNDDLEENNQSTETDSNIENAVGEMLDGLPW